MKTTQLYKNIKTFKTVIDRIFENTDDLVTRREYQLLEIFYWGANKTKDHVNEFSEFVKKNNLDEDLISYTRKFNIFHTRNGSERTKPITPSPTIPITLLPPIPENLMHLSLNLIQTKRLKNKLLILQNVKKSFQTRDHHHYQNIKF